jgi:pimeloyl-ACP methyl ester carboxylesterase
MENLKKFKIEVSQSILDDLKARLENTRWTDEPEHDGWNYGTNPKYLRELADYWKNNYDWRKHEAELNQFPQFKADIDGINIHFLYIKGKGSNPKPLILTHEWPDSFYRFYKIIPMLTDPTQFGGDADQSFDVIIPSMPGHGFSDKVSMSSTKTAKLWLKLMKETLGYDQFFAAGDFAVTTALALQNPEAVQAIHLTDTGYPNGTEDWSTMSPEEQAFGQHIQRWWFMEGAFNMIQSTKPQTLGYGLNDSPVGLASWIVEKLYAWSDTKGNLDNSLSKDEVITNIMIYWVSQTINTSIRRYMEDAREMYATGMPAPIKRVEVPTSIAVFPADSDTPRAWAKRRVNVTRFTKMPNGGRFAALEVPELYANDLRDSFFA